MKARPGWRTLDFRPDDAGWRAVYLDKDGPGWTFQRVVGWLIQEEVLYDARSYENLSPDEQPLPPDRRIVAGVVVDDIIEAASGPANFWYLLARGDLNPTGEAALEARRRREKTKQLRNGREQEERGTAD